MYLWYNTDKNKYPQASADFHMIHEAKQVLEGILRHNDAMKRTQEREEYLQCQEEDRIKDK